MSEIKKQSSLLSVMGDRYNIEPGKLHQILRSTAFAKCRSDEELMAMCVVANQYGLNPLTKEIYAFPNKDGSVIPVVGVDGWSRIMNEHPEFDGLEFEENEESCTCIIWRKDRTRPVRCTEWMKECKGDTIPWRSHPRRMLRHRALIQAARLAFGFAGIYDKEEVETEAEAQVVSEPIVQQTSASIALTDKIVGMLPPISETESEQEKENAER